VLHRLLEFIKGIEPALEQCAAIDRGFDPALTSVEQADTESIFEIGNGLRYRRLRHGKLRGSLSHAAAARDCHQNIQIPKIEMAPEPPLPVLPEAAWQWLEVSAGVPSELFTVLDHKAPSQSESIRLAKSRSGQAIDPGGANTLGGHLFSVTAWAIRSGYA